MIKKAAKCNYTGYDMNCVASVKFPKQYYQNY